MKMPPEISKISLIEDFETDHVFPPYGFHPFYDHELGNGDYFGLYWPVGREQSQPLVAEMQHDNKQIVPFYSSLERFLFHCSLGDYSETEGEGCWEDDPRPAPPSIYSDPLSPFALYHQAKELLKKNLPEKAVESLEKALSIVPEYTDAANLLYSQYARLGKMIPAMETAMNALISPPSLGIKDIQTLRWLQKQPSCPPEYVEDPIWKNREKIVFTYGGKKENADYPIYQEAIAYYRQSGNTWKAIVLSITVGELMACETVAFRGRYAFTPTAHLTALKDLFKNLQGSH